jgi:hypothetical protein
MKKPSIEEAVLIVLPVPLDVLAQRGQSPFINFASIRPGEEKPIRAAVWF